MMSKSHNVQSVKNLLANAASDDYSQKKGPKIYMGDSIRESIRESENSSSDSDNMGDDKDKIDGLFSKLDK